MTKWRLPQRLGLHSSSLEFGEFFGHSSFWPSLHLPAKPTSLLTDSNCPDEAGP